MLPNIKVMVVFQLSQKDYRFRVVEHIEPNDEHKTIRNNMRI